MIHLSERLLAERDRLDGEIEELQRRHVLGLPVELDKALELGMACAKIAERLADYIEEAEDDAEEAQGRVQELENQVDRLEGKIERLEKAKAPA